jgi:hypothetical protein
MRFIVARNQYLTLLAWPQDHTSIETECILDGHFRDISAHRLAGAATACDWRGPAPAAGDRLGRGAPAALLLRIAGGRLARPAF